MANHILRPDLARLNEAGENNEDEEAKIEERVSQFRAEEMLETYKKLKIQRRASVASTINEPLISNESDVYDQLFVLFGEDIQDIKKAFKYYGLDETITKEDEERFAIN
jgi:hypothetical protein